MSGKYDGKEKVIMLLPARRMKSRLFSMSSAWTDWTKVPPLFIATRELKIAMMGESECDARVAPIYKRYTRCRRQSWPGRAKYSCT